MGGWVLDAETKNIPTQKVKSGTSMTSPQTKYTQTVESQTVGQVEDWSAR
jgi:hypothetical protein